MSNNVCQIGRWLTFLTQETGKWSVAAAGLWGLCAIVPTVASAEELAVAEEGPAEVALAVAEESVLIAKREFATDTKSAPAAMSDDQGTLEPISQVPKRSPELAEEGPADFAKGLAETELPAQEADSSDATAQTDIVPEPAKFNGVQPGTSTKKDLLGAWNEPTGTAEAENGEVISFAMEPFESIDVLVVDDTVSAIRISLAGELPPEQLAEQLSLHTFTSVEVRDEDGVALGEVYPERGVLFMYGPVAETATEPAPDAPLVTHVVIQPLDANAFALRAEQRLHGPYEQNIQDLSFALSLNPELAHAQWLLADIYLATGRADLAESAAAAACELEPDNAAYTLRRAQVLRLLGRYDEATRDVRSVVDQEDIAPLTKAQAMHEMALLAMLGEGNISSKAISFDLEAIRTADQVASSTNIEDRRAAKALLVDAHLAIARDVARHAFNDKVTSVAKWIGRASAIAEESIAQDGGSLELRLMVAKEALAAMASFKPSKDPAHFVAEAKQTAELLTEQVDGALWRQRIQWELGQAYFHAAQVEHLRGQSDSALRYGQLAIENLAAGAEARQAVHEWEQMVGALYFQIGAVHAVHKQDHQQAVEWYNKAYPLLTAPRPFSELLVPQREGEQLVSMGVSYWQVGEKEKALELTLSGLELIQQAVDAGILADTSLGVPYSNLASMYQQLGQPGNASKYAHLATSLANRPAAETASSAEQPRDMVDPGRVLRPDLPVRQTTQNEPAAPPASRSTQRAGQTMLK